MGTRKLEDINKSGELSEIKTKGSASQNQIFNENELAQAFASGLFAEFRKGGAALGNTLLSKDEIEALLPTLHYAMRYRGMWNPDETYYLNDVVNDAGWLMHCVADLTGDRPAPRATYDVGNEFFPLEEPATLVSEQHTGYVSFGHEYTVRTEGWLDRVDIKIPVINVGTTIIEIYMTTFNASGKEIVTRIPAIDLTADTWSTVEVPKTYFNIGDKFNIKVELMEVSPSPEFNVDYIIKFGSGDPAPGELLWVSDTQLMINKVDADGVDISSTLSTLQVGSLVFVKDTSLVPDIYKDFQLRFPPVLSGNVFLCEVMLVGQRGNWDALQNQKMPIEISYPDHQPVAFYREATYAWDTLSYRFPFSNVKGLLEYGGVPQSADLDAFGVRAWYQSAYSSADWELMKI